MIGRRGSRDGGRTDAGAARRPGLFGRLRRDVRANTLAMMAIALIPISALAGSAVDMARTYVVKARLQQACDAGVLAGRKFLAASSSSTIDTNASTQATTFFRNNFASGWMNTSSVSFTPTKTTDNQVAGIAYATVPMSVMQMFGVPATTLKVTCQARFDVADGDVMFVLDTTGSMACLTSDSQNTCDSYVVTNTKQDSGGYYVTEKNNSRLSGLRTAVLNFYDTVTSQADPTTHFRYGFMPYSATVNVGKLLPRSYLATSTWNYQSRVQGADTASGNATSNSYSNVSQGNCNGYAGRTPSSGYYSETSSNASNNDYYYTVVTSSWTKNSSNSNGTCSTSTQKYVANFTYRQATFDISNYASGNSVTTPTLPQFAPGVTQPTSTWAGCIEERDTTASSTFDTSNPPPDLDVDTAPSSEATRWRPLWPEVVYSRQSTTESSVLASRTPATRYQFGSNNGVGYEYGGPYNELPCPTQAQRLQTMSRSDVSNYVNASGFRPYGVTYHDVGLTWGTRLLSSSGIFAGDTAAWPGHNAPNRYIIFLTDGTMETDEYAYTSHGIEQFDNRVGSGGNNTTLTNLHNARFAAACTIAKNHNIKVFVISYAQALTTQLTNCASPNQAYYASDSASLNTAFQTIAAQVAMLRISQ